MPSGDSLARFFEFYAASLFNPHWGEQVTIGSDNTLKLSMVCQGLDRQQAPQVWRPFFDWVAAAREDFTVTEELGAVRAWRGIGGTSKATRP